MVKVSSKKMLSVLRRSEFQAGFVFVSLVFSVVCGVSLGDWEIQKRPEKNSETSVKVRLCGVNGCWTSCLAGQWGPPIGRGIWPWGMAVVDWLRPGKSC